MTSPHERPMELDEILSFLRQKQLKRAVVVKAQYSPDPVEVERTLVFSDRGRWLNKVADEWLTPETYKEVLRQFDEVAVGSCSAMYGTKPTYVWAVHCDELRLWESGTLVAHFTSQETQVRRKIVGLWSRNPNTHFACVHAFLSKTWIRRGVKLERKIGGNILVAKSTEISAFIDPTYDGLDVMCDASWVTNLARSITDITGIELKVDSVLS